jgi:hypothetical protein
MKELILGAVFLAVIIVLSVWARLDWVDQCVADGHQRYECEERYDRAHPPAPQVNVHHH